MNPQMNMIRHAGSVRAVETAGEREADRSAVPAHGPALRIAGPRDAEMLSNLAADADAAGALGMFQRWMATASSKWCIPILDRLAERPARYKHLLAGLDSVAPKVLTQTLRRLESEGFVISEPVGRIGRRYRLTQRGTDLHAQIRPMRRWAAEELLAGRDRLS